MIDGLMELIYTGSQIVVGIFFVVVIKYEIDLLENIADELHEIKTIIKEKSGRIISICPQGSSSEDLSEINSDVSLGDFGPSLTSSSENTSDEDVNWLSFIF